MSIRIFKRPPYWLPQLHFKTALGFQFKYIFIITGLSIRELQKSEINLRFLINFSKQLIFMLHNFQPETFNELIINVETIYIDIRVAVNQRKIND